MLVDDVIDQHLRRPREHQAGDAIHDHQTESAGQQAETWTHEHPDFRPGGAQPVEKLLLRLGLLRQSNSPYTRKKSARHTVTAFLRSSFESFSLKARVTKEGSSASEAKRNATNWPLVSSGMRERSGSANNCCNRTRSSRRMTRSCTFSEYSRILNMATIAAIETTTSHADPKPGKRITFTVAAMRLIVATGTRKK